MDLKSCYEKFGGDFDEVLGRLRKESLVEKFMLKFLDDKSYELFETSMQQQNYDEALRGVHTLKGIAQNLAFTQLFGSSQAITKALKESDVNAAIEMSPQLSKDYHMIIDVVEEYKNSKEG